MLVPGRPAGRLAELPELLRVPASLELGEIDPATSGRPALSLAAALSRGVIYSREVQAAEARRAAYGHTLAAAKGAGRPQVTLRVAQGRGNLTTATETSTLNRNDSALTIRQALYDRPMTLEMERQATLLLAAELQWRSAVSTASVDVASAYLQALQSRLSLEISREHELRLGELYDYISKRADAGGASKAERDRVKARVANARSQMADARATLRTAMRQLEGLLGQAPGALQVSLPDDLSTPHGVLDALDEARQSNADLASGRSEIDALRTEASGHRAKLRPRLELEMTGTYGMNAAGSGGQQRDGKVMLVLNWALADGGVNQAQESATLARQREKALRLEESERKLRQELEGAYANLEATGERYAAIRTELDANTSVADAFKAQLVGGNRPLLDVLDAYQRLHQSRLDLASLAVAEVQNQFKVSHLTGRLFNLGWRP